MNKDSVNKDSIKTDSINIEFKPMTSEYNPINTNENDENEYVQLVSDNDISSGVRRANCNAKQSQEEELRMCKKGCEHAKSIQQNKYMINKIDKNTKQFVNDCEENDDNYNKTKLDNKSISCEYKNPYATNNPNGEYEVNEYNTNEYECQEYTSVYKKT